MRSRRKIIVPTQAYRDEGLSYHYAPPADYITMKNAGRVSEWLEEMGLPHVSGRTWTSDAIYRETKANVDKRKAEAVLPWKWNVPVCRQSAISEALTCIIT